MMKIEKYLNRYKVIISNIIKDYKKISQIISILKSVKKRNKILVFGNGGSALIASHFALDATNVLNKKCLNISDSGIITCFSNDYGFDNWIDKAIKRFADKNDILFLISSSGTSKNMINAVSKNKNIFRKIITLTGKANSKLVKLSDINIQVDSKTYNIIENSHQIILLTIIDLIKEKKLKK